MASEETVLHKENLANSIGSQVGKKLHLQRKIVGKTLQQVAKETDLSVSFISQVERGLSTPSLTSFYKLAKALNASMEALLEIEEARSPVTHADSRLIYNLGDPNRTYEHLSPGYRGATVSAVMIHSPPNIVSELFSHEGEEFVYLVEGEVQYELGNEKYILKAGDTIQFKSEVLHRTKVLSPNGAVELWVGTMPLYSKNDGQSEKERHENPILRLQKDNF